MSEIDKKYSWEMIKEVGSNILWSPFVLLPFCFGVVLLIWSYYPYLIAYFFDNKYGSVDILKDLGTFGDSYGALNTLFSGLAFSGIIVSIFLQSKELKETRVEIKQQVVQFEKQSSALEAQVFENTFFQLLNLHNEIATSIEYETSEGVLKNYKGRVCFEKLQYEFVDHKYGRFLAFIVNIDTLMKKDVAERYKLFHLVYGDKIGHYFRNIYQILKYINESKVENKKFYTNLLRAQMSTFELSLLFYNCLSELGIKKFKPLIEKYEFLEHLPKLDFIDDNDVLQYKASAFGDSIYWKHLIKP